jgi:hypothetical protein
MNNMSLKTHELMYLKALKNSAHQALEELSKL